MRSNDVVVRMLSRYRPKMVFPLIGFALVASISVSLWETAGVSVVVGDDVIHQQDVIHHQAAQLDPAAWGTNHVGQPVPEYLTGGECLFCHRDDVGASWSTDRHNRTVRPIATAGPSGNVGPAADVAQLPDDAPAYLARDADALAQLRRDDDTSGVADEVELLLGDARSLRFLRRGEKYGTARMLSVAAHTRRGRRYRLYHDADTEPGAAHFHEGQYFASRCAGCHTTAVDPKSLAFATTGLDCYTCHGTADAEHANDATLMLLSRDRKDPPRVVVSICGSCHIRHGRSRSTGRPFANNFVAGDNLFQDMEVDFAAADDAQLNLIDRHVLVNVRDVVIAGNDSLTCLTCHDVHGASTRRHRELADAAYCALCHDPNEPKTRHRSDDVHSEACGY